MHFFQPNVIVKRKRQVNDLNFLVRLAEVNKLFLSQYISEGNTVVDCTMGNGYDTLMLAEFVGKTGKVYAFDVQQTACERTRLLLAKEHIEQKNVFLINSSHENIKKYINESIHAAVFNLGYLPNGDHNITTKSTSTIDALKHCLEILEVNGVVSITLYQGHDKGCEEKRYVLDFANNLNSSKYHTLYLDMTNQKNDPPSLLFITKKK